MGREDTTSEQEIQEIPLRVTTTYTVREPDSEEEDGALESRDEVDTVEKDTEEDDQGEDSSGSQRKSSHREGSGNDRDAEHDDTGGAMEISSEMPRIRVKVMNSPRGSPRRLCRPPPQLECIPVFPLKKGKS